MNGVLIKAGQTPREECMNMKTYINKPRIKAWRTDPSLQVLQHTLISDFVFPELWDSSFLFIAPPTGY